MEQTLRVELQYDGMKKSIFYGYFYDVSVETIEKNMKGRLVAHPVVFVYTKRGKKPIYSFQG